MNRPKAIRACARAAFVLFAGALHTATHWPQLVIVEAPFSWFDKVVHACSFFVWTSLLILSAFFGPAASSGNRIRCVALGLLAGGLDELTQGLPMVGRDPSWGDFLADAVGVLAAGAVSFACRSWLTHLDSDRTMTRK